MATPNIVPRSDSEGGLGTASKYWAAAYIDAITTTGDVTVGGGIVGPALFEIISEFSNRGRITLSSANSSDSTVQISLLTGGTQSIGVKKGGQVDISKGALTISSDGSNAATLTESASGDFTIASVDDLRLESGGNDIVLRGASSTEFGRLTNSSGDFVIQNITADKDIIFKADDGSGGTTTFFFLDGSHGGGPVTMFPDNSSINFGSTLGDLKISHDSTNSTINNGTGALSIRNSADGNDINFQCDDGSGGTTTYFRLDGGNTQTEFEKNAKFLDSVELRFGTSNDLKIYHDSTNSFIQNITGHLTIQSGKENKDLIFKCDDGQASNNTVATYFFLDGSSATHDGSATTALFTNWPDNSRISLGTSHDLMIYHNGTHSWIWNDVGDLYINNAQDGGDIIFRSDDGSGGIAEYFRLYGSHSGNPITQFPDNSQLHFGDGFDFRITHDGSQSILNNQTGNLEIVNNADNADIIFKASTGTNAAVTYFQLDGSDGLTLFSKNTRHIDNVRAYFGNSNDGEIVHNGTNFAIQNLQGGGDMKIINYVDGRDIIFSTDDGTGGVAEYFRLDGGMVNTVVNKDFRFEDNVKLTIGSSQDLQIHHDSTNSNITNKTGTLFINQDVNGGDMIFRSDDGTGGIAEYFRLDGGEVETRFSKATLHFDNVWAKFGTGGDLRIYHDGNNSYIEDAGTGNLSVTTNSFRLLNAAGDENMIQATENGSVVLYHNNIAKLETTSAGSKIHGALTVEGTTDQILNLNVTDDGPVYHAYLRNSNRHAYVGFGGSDDVFTIANEETNGDIVFRAYDGSGSTTVYLHLDASEVSTKILTQKVMMTNLPTSDPGNSGQLWNDNGTLKISVG